MPRLTETLLKSGGARNPNVNFKKFYNYTTTYTNNKIVRPNILGNRVSTANAKHDESACREEMLMLMTCWKKHEFRENTCDEEYKAFSKCNANLRAKLLKVQQFSDTSELGVKAEDGKLNPHQANKLLRMFPQPPYRVDITHGRGHPMRKPMVFEGKSDSNTMDKMPPKIWKQKRLD